MADAEESTQKASAKEASAKTADRRANDESVLLSPPPPRHGTLGDNAQGRGGQLRAGHGGRGRGEEGGRTHRIGHHVPQVLKVVVCGWMGGPSSTSCKSATQDSEGRRLLK